MAPCTATQLYGPNGAVRYQSGTLPTSYGYTGQRADATTGLYYYTARYYDPVAGQFTSADTTRAGGLNRYAYVGGNPESATDPSGHMRQSTVSDNLKMAQALAQAYGFKQQPDVYFNGTIFDGAANLVSSQLGLNTLSQSWHTIFQDPHASTGDKVKAAGVAGLTIVTDVVSIGSLFVGEPEVGEGARAADEALMATVDAEEAAAATTNATTEAAAVTGQGDALSLAATNSSDTGATVDLYRAVGVREYNSVMETGRFNPGTNSLEARQFALSQDDALAYANRDVSKVAILKATIRGNALESFDFSTSIDPNLFKRGVVTVQPGEQSEVFHQALLFIEQVL